MCHDHFSSHNEVEMMSSWSFSSPAEYDVRWSPHSWSLWMDHWRKLYLPVPQRLQMGLGRPWGMCPGCPGHGQRVPRPLLHPLLHDVISTVSLCVSLFVPLSEMLLKSSTVFNSLCVFCGCRQYVSSCKTGNMDSALSIWFLLLWLGGDSCNLVGSFLADQLPLQVISLQQWNFRYSLKHCRCSLETLINVWCEKQEHCSAITCVLISDLYD